MNDRETNFAIRFGCVAALLMGIVYPIMINTHGYEWWNYILEMSFGPLFMISHIGLYLFFKKHQNSFYNLLAMLFHILAGAAVLLCNIIQKSVFTIGKDYGAIENGISKEIIRTTYKLGNLTQLAIDYYFDVLVSIATLFIALAILKQQFYWKWLVIPGIIISIGGLVVNTIKFPIPPADSGLFDPGPFYAIYSAVLFLPMIYHTFLKKTKS